MNKEDSLVCEESIKNIAEFHEIEKVIEIVEEWSKENPVETNLDVFRDVFAAWETYSKYCEKKCGISNCTIPCEDCSWWDEEYKGE
jgi:hypothetical protein